PPPLFTAISDDTGSSATDQITTDQTLTLSGTAEASKTVTLYRADVGQLGTTTADGSGNWTFNYTGTTLAEGTYAFTAIETSGSKTSVETGPFRVKVDRTAPAVTLTTDASTYDLTPEVRVVAT